MNQEQVKNYEEAMLGSPNEPALDPKGFYYIDFNKITRAEDIVAILAALNVAFIGNHPRVHLVAHLLDRENPAYPKENQFGQPLENKPEISSVKLKLPELKKVTLPKVKKVTTSTTTTETAVKPENEDGGSGL